MTPFSKIVAETFRIKESDVRDDLTPADVPDWDSMNYIFFIGKLEEEFGFSFTLSEVKDSKNLGDIRKVVEERGKNHGS